MARTTVEGIKIAGRAQPLPIEEERWGIHGPIQTRWVNLHVYWVIPLAVTILLFLVLSAFDAFDQKEVIKTILVPAPATSHSGPSPATAEEQGMTTATIKAALAEADTIAKQMRPLQEKAVTRDSVEASKPEPPPKASIWDSPKNQ